MAKACSSCPSMLTPEAARDRFSRPLGAYMCGRHGYVLNRPDADHSECNEAYKAFAENCEDYMEPLPATPVSLRPRVATVSEEVIEGGPTGMSVASCHGCQNCVKHTVVLDTWGWPLPLCKAKGTLIFDPTRENKGCEWARPGGSSESLFDVDLRKEFQPGFTVNSSASLEAMVNNGNLNVEPTTYQTDAEVDPDDAADGIRAWRRLACPLGTGREIFMPIFDPSIFSEAERSQIPQTGGPHLPELYVDYANLVWKFAVEEWMLGQTLLIQSFPGLGKTELAYYLGWLMQMPVTRVYFQTSIEWDDIFGKAVFQKGETGWQDGRFTAAFRRPGIILVDEPNMAQSEIVATLRTSTELDATLFLDAGYANDDGERVKLEVKPHKYNFRMWCSNPAWDPRNIGTKELAAADISRLSPAYLSYPPVGIEKTIIKSTVLELDGFDIPNDLLDDMMKVSTDIRAASEAGDYPGTWGIRENVKVARKLAWYPFVEAYRMSALNYFEPETAAFIIDSSIKTIRSEDI